MTTQLVGIEDLQVYVVEPSIVQSNYAEARLNKLGINRIHIFNHGKELLDEMAKTAPDVVISSMYLPDMDGGELIQRIRQQEWDKKIAFILISSETNPRYLEPVRQSGSSAILRKPYQVEQLHKALTAALDYISPDPDEFDLGRDIDLDLFKVLLVDDSRLARKHIRQVLESLGILNFVEAENGKQAAECIDESMFDLVVTDYNMPEMDGRELTEYIRTKSMQSHLPILMVSSEQNENRLAAVEQAGVSGVCDKPFEPEVVKEMLEVILLGD